MDKRLLFALLLAPTLASAQTVPPPFTTQGAVPTITQWSNAWSGKQDAITAGVVTNWGNVAHPIYVAGRPNDTIPNIGLSQYDATAGTFGIGLQLDNVSYGVVLPSASALRAYIGFTNSLTYGTGIYPDIAFTSFGVGQAVFVDRINPTAPTALRVFNTYTDASNGEWGGFDWQTTPNELTIGTGANGTGTTRFVNISVNNSAGLQVDNNANVHVLGSVLWVHGGILIGSGGISGVSCAAGTVSAATMVVTNGIITHC